MIPNSREVTLKNIRKEKSVGGYSLNKKSPRYQESLSFLYLNHPFVCKMCAFSQKKTNQKAEILDM